MKNKETCLTANFRKRSNRYKTFSKFYRCPNDLVSNLFLNKACLSLIFYGDCINLEKLLVGMIVFPDQFRKIIIRYIRIGYNMNVMRQPACLMVNHG